jgi:hypothetical protein
MKYGISNFGKKAVGLDKDSLFSWRRAKASFEQNFIVLLIAEYCIKVGNEQS